LKDINQLHHNSYGIAFKWESNIMNTAAIQLVFRDINMSLPLSKLHVFLNNVQKTLSEEPIKPITDNNSKSYVLETPSSLISLVMSFNELENLQDLLEGAIFKINMEIMLN